MLEAAQPNLYFVRTLQAGSLRIRKEDFARRVHKVDANA
jgi:hypothetical protein